jgi:hypothetical protein
MSGRRSRNKGARIEREIVRALQAKGLAASRVPLSGAVGGRFSGDVVLPLLGRDLCVEVKARADGFRELYSWLASRDVLIVKADRQPPLVVVRLALASEVAVRRGEARIKSSWLGNPMTAKKKPEVEVHDLSKRRGALKAIGGSMSDDWNNIVATASKARKIIITGESFTLSS